MSLALPVLSDLPQERTWSFGGGTALALQIDHRVSFDIDIFLTHSAALIDIYRNPKTSQISDVQEFPGNHLKIVRPEGEIDFILAANITDDFYRSYDFKEIAINLETPEEIIAKKIRYRGSNFTYRDIYDLAATIQVKPDIMEGLADIDILESGLKRVLQRVEFLQNNKHMQAQLVGADLELQDAMFTICVSEIESVLEGSNSFQS